MCEDIWNVFNKIQGLKRTADKNNLLFIFSGTAAHRGLWPPRPQGFLITQNEAPQSAALLWKSDQLVAGTST
jgi:hypothetical protein